MAISLPIFSPQNTLMTVPPSHLHTYSFLTHNNSLLDNYKKTTIKSNKNKKKTPFLTTTTTSASPLWYCSCSSSNIKIVRNPWLDKQVVKNGKIRFVQKLKTLLLSKPKHFMPLKVLSKCRSYLSLPPARSILSMIKRYPAIFELFSTPSDLLAVRLTPKAASIASEESLLKTQIADSLATKLQKLLMLSTHRRLLLSKLVHLAPNLGLPPNFRSRLCNDFAGRFKIVDTSYGRALELVSWDPILASPLPHPPPACFGDDLIVDRPRRFKQLRLRKGLNLKRKHREFLIKFGELPEINPYAEAIQLPPPHTLEAEKRACGVVREVLGLTVEKRTLVDHLTHFRCDFGLPNKLRGMLVRHPDMFYISIKGQRDSVFLVEGYDDRGKLVDGKDELLVAKEKLMELVREGKRMRKERRNRVPGVDYDEEDNDEEDEDYDEEEEEDEDGFEELFEVGIEDDWEEFGGIGDEVGSGGGSEDAIEEFWTAKAPKDGEDELTGKALESW